MPVKNTGWWSDFFDEFRLLFYNYPKKATNAEVKFFINKLKLTSRKKFLDCPCGIGRIAIPFAKKGIKVTGVDITKSYLAELTQKTKKQNLKIELYHNDMRRINFDSQFDAAGNLWTSFGFFEKESDNLLTLKKMYKALKPGGRFALHLINRDWLVHNYTPRGWWEVKGVKVVEERKFDYSKSINYGKWHFIKDGKETSYNVNLRIYSYHELIAMFKSVGFVDIEGYGSVKEEPINRDTRMMYIFGVKPKK